MAIICYSVDSAISLKNVVERWFPEVRHFCPLQPVILAGNKVDLRPASAAEIPPGKSPGDDVTVALPRKPKFASAERGEEVAAEISARRFVECSAKTRRGVHDVFLAAASAAIDFRRHRHKHKNCSIL